MLSRLCHVNILWADEDYHLAAAIQMLHGKMLYRDLWYDKPPLTAMIAVLFGAFPGWPLRIAGTVLAAASCAVAFRSRPACGAGVRDSGRPGCWHFRSFYLPAATIPLEPDTLMILPHLAAVYLAWKQKPLAAGLAAGLAFAMNIKGLMVLLVCLIFAPAAWPLLIAGFLIPNVLLLGWLSQHAFSAYIESVWRWGLLYAGAPPGDSPVESALMRIRNWLGFHAALVLAAAWYWLCTKRRLDCDADAPLGGDLAGSRRRGLAILTALSQPDAAAPGDRGSPRHLSADRRDARAASAIRNAGTGRGGSRGDDPLRPALFSAGCRRPRRPAHAWRDLTLDQESRQVSALVRTMARKGDTIFIWGYRPNIVVYTRLPVASRMWESQPLTGVPADRHLRDANSVDPDWARQNRAELLRSSPSIIVDGLSAYNPRLNIADYPDLAAWFKRYCLAGRAGLTTVYRLCARTGVP